MCTRQSRKVIWDMINTLFLTLQLQNVFCCFPLAHANLRSWPLVPFFEISLKNSELKTTHNTFRDCHMHFFRQPFSKQLYQKNFSDNTELHISIARNKIIIFHKVDVPGPLLRRGPLWFYSCKRPPPVSDNSIFAFWVVAYGRFDCINLVYRASHVLPEQFLK